MELVRLIGRRTSWTTGKRPAGFISRGAVLTAKLETSPEHVRRLGHCPRSGRRDRCWHSGKSGLPVCAKQGSIAVMP